MRSHLRACKRIGREQYSRSLCDILRLRERSLPDARWFQPVTVSTGALSLMTIGLGGLLLALAVFQLREYRHLT
ncbi:MAG: hypothetical protein HY000_03760 [Planctomycetes bacterium]|nr:hypothetical protein [Planctomycetota bacterium]